MLSRWARVHTGGLELCDTPAGVHGLVLPDVTDEEDPVVGLEPLEERVHLRRAGETRFVEDVEVLVCRFELLQLGQVPLQSDSGYGFYCSPTLLGGSGRLTRTLLTR